jgi:hypothetical protein
MYLFLYGAERNDFDAGNIHHDGHWKGRALKSRLFWALKWQRAKRVTFGPKKVEAHPHRPLHGTCKRTTVTYKMHKIRLWYKKYIRYSKSPVHKT